MRAEDGDRVRTEGEEKGDLEKAGEKRTEIFVEEKKSTNIHERVQANGRAT